MRFTRHAPRQDDGARDDLGREARPGGVGPTAPTVLVVDDDASARGAVKRALEACGYDVVEAADGVDAVGAVRERAGRVSLVLTDVVMWRMGGGELSACLSSLYPGTRILFMSGYSEDVLRKQGLIPAGGAFVAKPYEPDALARRVRKLLGG